MNVIRFSDKKTGSVVAIYPTAPEEYHVDFGKGVEICHCSEIMVIDDTPITPPVAPHP